MAEKIFNSSDLLREIFIRLRMKPLCRFKCVCKHWQSLISGPSFADFAQLFHRHRATAAGFVVSTTKGNIKFYNILPHNGLIAPAPVDMNLRFIQQQVRKQSVILVDSNDGFLLFQKKPSPGQENVPLQYFLCNPITKQWVSLPKPENYHDRRNTSLFCYTGNNQRVEFIVICYLCHNKFNSVVEKYSSKTGIWKESILPVFCRLGENVRKTVFDGSVYWLEDSRCISVCDLESEEDNVDFIKFPSNKRKPKPRCLGLSSGFLYLAESSETCFKVYVLVNGNKWCLKHKATFESVTYPEEIIMPDNHEFDPNAIMRDSQFRALAFHPVNYQLVLVKLKNKIALYDMENEKIEIITGHGLTVPKLYTYSHFLSKDDFSSVFPYTLPAWPTYIPCSQNC